MHVQPHPSYTKMPAQSKFAKPAATTPRKSKRSIKDETTKLEVTTPNALPGRAARAKRSLDTSLILTKKVKERKVRTTR